jgi:hypothetical protein
MLDAIQFQFFGVPSASENMKYKIEMSHTILYGCETWSLILREEHRLRVLQNRVPRRIFGYKGQEVVQPFL